MMFGLPAVCLQPPLTGMLSDHQQHQVLAACYCQCCAMLSLYKVAAVVVCMLCLPGMRKQWQYIMP
jgi:hypothetical protein